MKLHQHITDESQHCHTENPHGTSNAQNTRVRNSSRDREIPLSRSIQYHSIKIFNSFGSNGLSKSIYWSCTALESSEEHNRLSSSAIFCSLAYVTPVAVGRHFSFTPPSTQRHWPLSLVLVIYYKPMINGVPLHLRLEYKVQTVFFIIFYREQLKMCS